MKKVKALALLSGGLDSTLAAKMMMEQGVEVIGLNFTSPFCGACSGNCGGKETKIQVTQRQLGIPIRFVPLDEDYVDVIRNPRHGYGQGINPCIDCRIYTMKKAKAVMEEEGADFLVSGEVLGQRPMSQRKDAMDTIDHEAGLEGLILRPLSAKEMKPTIAEEKGLVDRERLGGITGRSRAGQFEMAEQLEIREYPLPAGGCLLTDKIFAARLRDLFAVRDDVGLRDIHLLQLGRFVRLDEKVRAVVGRNQQENEALTNYRDRVRSFLLPVNFMGPSAAIIGTHDVAHRRTAAAVIMHYGRKFDGPPRIHWAADGDGEGEWVGVEPMPESDLRARLV